MKPLYLFSLLAIGAAISWRLAGVLMLYTAAHGMVRAAREWEMQSQ